MWVRWDCGAGRELCVCREGREWWGNGEGVACGVMGLEDGIDELEVDARRAEGIGMLLRGVVSRRYA